MYALFVVALGFLVFGAWQRVKIWRRGITGTPRSGGGALRRALRRVLRHVFQQVIIWRSFTAGLSHFSIFWGFIVLFIGTCIVAVEDYGTWLLGVDQLIFHGTFYLVVSCALEIFGVLFVGGLVVAMIRRQTDKRFPPLARPIDAGILWLFLALGVTGFLIEGLRIAATGMASHEFEKWSFVGWGLALTVSGANEATLCSWHLALWIFHMVGSMVFIAAIPYCKLRHILFAPLNIALSEPRQAGAYVGVSLEEVEETGKYGVAAVEDFTRRQLMSFDACTQCGRCQTVCPAHSTGKPLSPMRVVLDIAETAGQTRKLHGETISADVLWACTSCGACVEECPVAIDQLGAIVDMRRSLVGEGEIRGSEQAALRSVASSGNPWGLPQDERAAWADELEVPTVDDEASPEVLLWVGCAGSYDRRSQKVTRALVEILKAAGVSFAILGKKERCTGDPARRLGDEFTFLELAEANVETLNALEFQRVVTACPHCFNTIRNEYPQLGGDYEVLHHTQLIQELLESGRLKVDAEDVGAVSYHDPCYLGRQNREFDAPRVALDATGASLQEPEQSKEKGFCCGAGGGRMWMEEDVGQRVNLTRWKQLTVLQPKSVAVGCPFCMTMMSDAAAAEDSSIAVEDVAELVARSLRKPDPAS